MKRLTTITFSAAILLMISAAFFSTHITNANSTGEPSELYISSANALGNAWIELHNPTDNTVYTKGMYLSNDNENYLLWQIPATAIRADEKVRLIMGNNNTDAFSKRLKTVFNISGGDTLYLTEAGGDVVSTLIVPTPPSPPFWVTRDLNYPEAPDMTAVRTNTGGTLTNANLPNPTRDGYTFIGWYTEPEGGTQVTAGSGGWGYVFTDDTTIYAQWTTSFNAPFTITIDFQGGTSNDPATTKTTNAAGRLTSALYVASKEGYYFEGWFTELTGGVRVQTGASNGHIFTQDSTIYARFSPGRFYTITFDATGGTADPPMVTTRVDGTLTAVDLFAPKRTDATFLGWYSQPNGAGVKITTATQFPGDYTIYAHWETITIHFDVNGGVLAPGTPSSKTAGESGKVYDLPVATKDGYVFAGWFTSLTGITRVTPDTVFESYPYSDNDTEYTVFAKWTEVTVTFYTSGGTLEFGTANSLITDTATGTLSGLPVPTREGAVFKGWFTQLEGGAQITTSTVFTQNTNAYAQWTPTASAPFTITLVEVNTSDTKISYTMQTDSSGRLSELPTPTREGFTSRGWYTVQQGISLNTLVTVERVYTEDTTIYASWVAGSGNIFRVIHDHQGGSSYSSMSVTGTGGNISGGVSDATRPGYTFTGWYTEPVGGEQVLSGHRFTEDTTIYAQWIKGSYYTIKFNYNGGTSVYRPPLNEMLTDSDGRLGWLPTTYRTGYTFTGWFTKATGGDEVTAGEDGMVFTSDGTIYAGWDAN